MREIVLGEALQTNVVGGVQHILPGARVTEEVPFRVEFTRVRLGNRRHMFVRPINLAKGVYRVEGPGELTANFFGPTGAIVRLHRCIVTNRTEVAYPQNGIRYELEHLADLSLPNLSDENWRRYIEPFDSAYNRVTFGKGARFEMSEQDMLNLDR